MHAMNTGPRNWKRGLAVGLFFITLLVLGLSLVKNYGITIDEPTQHRYGQIVWEYVFKHNPRLMEYKDKYYGPAFEVVLYGAEKILHVKDSRKVYFLRHVFNFLLFYLAVWFFFWLCERRFQHWTWGLLGALALVVSPAIFAQAFYNSKDLPFLSLAIICFYTLWRFQETPTAKWSFLHALACALLIDIRVLGIGLPVLTGLWFGWSLYKPISEKTSRLVWVRAGVLYLVFLMGLVVLFWPTLWHQPFQGFLAAIREMKNFPWPGQVLYLGQTIPATALPWHYAPVWMGITIPVVYLAGMLLGIGFLVVEAVKNPSKTIQKKSLEITALLWVAAPVLAVIVFKSVLYNSWRHLYFVYPGILILALSGLRSGLIWWNSRFTGAWKKSVPVLIVAIVLASMGQIAWRMHTLYPYEHLYFNAFQGGLKGAQGKLELDYWGSTYFEGLEKVLQMDTAEAIPVFLTDPVVETSAMLLPAKQRQRIVWVTDLRQAKYYLDNGYNPLPAGNPHQAVYAVKREGTILLTVAELTQPRLPLARDKGFSLAALLQQNLTLMQQHNPGQLAATIQDQLRAGMNAYIRDVNDFQIEIEPFSTDKIRQGIIDQIRVKVTKGVLGDFQHNPVGIPFEILDLTVHGLVVDLKKMRSGEIAPFSIKRITINVVELRAQAVNQALSQSSGQEKDLRVFFEQGLFKAQWLGKPLGEVDVALRVAEDAQTPGSDNLYFDIQRVRVSSMPIPTRVVNWLLWEYNPLIPQKKLNAILKLGTIRLQDGSLYIGTAKQKE